MFPFKDISCLKTSLMNGEKDIGEEMILSYDSWSCLLFKNADEVTDLFDSYEEAKDIAEEKN